MFLACCVLPDKKRYGNRLCWCKYILDINGVTLRLKATVPDRRVGLPASACVIVAVRLNKALIKTRTASVRPASPKACTLGNETRTQNACASAPIRIVSYSYAVIVPCTVLYDIPINVAYKTLSKYFIQVLSFVTPVHIHTAFTKLTSKFLYLSQSAKIWC